MHQRIRPGLFVVLWALSAVACRPAELTYTVRDGATTVPVTGRYETTGDVLAAAGLSPAEEDTVAPGLNAPADPATPIVIDRAAEVTVITPDSVTTWRTQAQTLGAFLAEAGLAPPPGSRLLADGKPLAIEDAANTPLPADIIFDPWKRVIVTDGNQRRALRTTALTVGEALAEAEIALGALDNVEPPREAVLVPEMAILIERAAPYVVVADGHTVSVQSDSTQVFDILADNGIALGPLDYTRPATGAAVAPGDTIEVVRVTERIDTVEEAVPFETVFEAAPDLEIDTLIEAAPGSNGVLQRLTRVRLENGVEVSSEPGGESLLVAPVNRVLRYGTNIIMRTIDTPEGPVEYWRKVTMRVTSYTATSAGKKPGEPGYGITASGVQAGTGVIAVDPKVIPFRSYVYVPGYGVAFAGDTGGGIKGRFVDLGYDEDEFQSWRGTVDVYYLGPPPPAEEIRWILP
ncbi:MAG TPA: ubiquitin-like domain-containing protein [Promineifilum sp.]|nr:ubiquitin-like domain-containing protein [Promineifilum sp.]